MPDTGIRLLQYGVIRYLRRIAISNRKLTADRFSHSVGGLQSIIYDAMKIESLIDTPKGLVILTGESLSLVVT